MYLLHGELKASADDSICPQCGSSMHIHNRCEVNLRHLCFGDKLSCLRFTKLRYYCPRCGHSHMQDVPFQAKGHRISCELLNYTRDLLAYGFTNKQVAYLTGLGKNTVKDIDLKRLKEKYTVDGERLIQPERQARFLGIDEFKLHDGHKYAVIIIDMETGHILWLAHGKKKASVYSFIEHVGKDWMDGVEAVACDMNSDFQEAFEDRCPHIQTVFDFFHIVKNFNDKVVGQIRKDEQRRLIAEGDEKAAKSLKGSRYILTSSKQTLARKDQEAEDGKILSKGSSLFSKEQVVRKDGHLARYEDIIRQNKLLFTLDLIKEKLCEAYKMTDEPSMAGAISEIMDMCMATGNKHLLWFRRLLDNHFEGIIAHATYDISAGKIEGVNNRIKTLRRQGYGYPDDDYFFLKLFDASRKGYVRNPVAERIPQNL
ncbi:MAG: ISL3 family transposase [Sphaerochaeta sp.]|nr:ISL3 family transposase [Sphaerochaeta sp.]